MRFFALAMSVRMEIKMSEPYFQNSNQGFGVPNGAPQFAQQNFPRVENYVPYVQKKPPRKPNKLLKCTVLFAISLILMLLFLCPLVHTTTEINGKEYSVSFNSIDCFKIAFYSARSLDTASLAETDLYKEVFGGEVSSVTDPSQLTPSEGAEYIKNVLFLQLMSDMTPFRFSTVLAIFAITAYLTLCIVLLVYSLLSIIGELSLIVKRSNEENLHLVSGQHLVWFILLFTPLLYYSYMQMFAFDASFALFGFSKDGASASYGFVLSVLVVLLGSVYFSLPTLIGKIRDGGLKFLVKKSTELLALGFTLVFLLSFSLLCLSANISVKDNSKKYEDNLSIDYYDINEITSSDSQKFRDYLFVDGEGVAESVLINYVGNANENAAKKLMISVTSGGGINAVNKAYVLVIIFNCCALLLFALLAHTLINSILYDSVSDKVGTLKKLLCATASIQVVLTVTMFIVLNQASIGGENCLMEFKVGFGPILGLLSTIGMLISFEKTPHKEIERSYDNPDVSYAPYVVNSSGR